jgi:2-iminoacetate synthase
MNAKPLKTDDIIKPAAIKALLAKTDTARAEAVIEKAAEAGGLTPDEAAVLLHIEDELLLNKLFAAAGYVKERIYGRRIVLFAPLYIANYCVNQCRYCGYQQANTTMPRRRLTQEAIAAETLALLQMGHKRLALETGEDPVNIPLSYILDSIKTIYGVNYKGHNLRRINVNIAASSVDDYARLHAAQIGTYILFQESYHEQTYKQMHAGGPKANFYHHTTAMHRAMQGGIDDVGMGVLYGLYDYKFETLALLNHVRNLEEHFGVGAHTISVPRLRQAAGVSPAGFKHLVSDRDFLKIIAVIRLALPYTGIILSTRESEALRLTALRLGVSQVSAASATGIGGYTHKDQSRETAQFSVSDERSLAAVSADLCRNGYLPSFCTACYRQGRTGEHFMDYAKSGEIVRYCTPNALLTFKEYVKEFAPSLVGSDYFEKITAELPDSKIMQHTRQALRQIENGGHDLYL